MPEPARLEAIGVIKSYGSVVALAGVDLRVDACECVALVGESGSGKSTLLRCFNALVVPNGGDVLIDGRRVATLNAIDLRRSIGCVPQDGGLLPHWNVERNVGLVPWLREMPDAPRRVLDSLGRVGLDPATFANRYPRELSGGQRQRVAIARAIAASPDVLLLDEPFGALDAITRTELQAMFDALRHASSITTVIVTHDLREAARLADRVVVLRHGAIETVTPASGLRDAAHTPYVRSLVEAAYAS